MSSNRVLLVSEMKLTDWICLCLMILITNIACGGPILLPSWYGIFMKDNYNTSVLISMLQLSFGLSFLTIGAIIAPKIIFIKHE